MGNVSRNGTKHHGLSNGPTSTTATSRQNTCEACSCVATGRTFTSDNAGVCATVLVISCIGCLLSSASVAVFCRLLDTCTHMVRISMYKQFGHKTSIHYSLTTPSEVFLNSALNSLQTYGGWHDVHTSWYPLQT